MTHSKIQNCTQLTKIAHITHNFAHITHFKVKQILTGEDGPLKLNLVIKQHILMVKTGQFKTKCKGDTVIALKWQISLWYDST